MRLSLPTFVAVIVNDTVSPTDGVALFTVFVTVTVSSVDASGVKRSSNE